ncbi:MULTISPECIES: sigma-70 family RNA polymerase sigma factor [Gracilibacillus]|uniref:sigma-70 family RNA polymerase sigma factor n=1 Tax=Gracilibacillus TaxID=74385 RepID=UPI000826F831|nr:MULTISPECIES: sigma-70 family RNA polymerase sigma factor [Gracilibacillus]
MKDIKLVKKAIKGNQKALERLLRQESDKLYKTAFLYVHNQQDALDILQETTYKALISIGQLKQPAYFSTWLTRILIHTAYDVIDQQKKLIYESGHLENLSVDYQEEWEAKLDIQTAIASLNKEYQSVIILFYYHDLPIEQIASILECPENTIKTYLRRARIELKKRMEGDGYDAKRSFL